MGARGQTVRVARTVVVESARIPRKLFKVFVEVEGMYRNMVEQLTIYAVRNTITSFTRLKALKYRELRRLYPKLPSHYAYTACQDSSTRAKSFIRLKKLGQIDSDYPRVEKVSIWLDDHLWRLEGYTSIKIATHKGWIRIEFEPHKQYWKYINGGWKPASEAKIKLDKRNKKIKIYLVLIKDIEPYKPRGYIPVDVNEDNIAILVDDKPVLLETNMKKITLGYYYRRKRVQEKYDKIYGVKSRVKKKILRKLREKKKKHSIRWKTANIIVREAVRRGYGIALEQLGRRSANNMIKKVRDRQLRHRIYQASFKSIQNAIAEKAREYGVPVIYVDPRNTSRQCPIHRAPILYDNGSRIGKCSIGGEFWHRDVVACYNILSRTLGVDGSYAPKPLGITVDGRPVPLASTAAHDPIVLDRGLWERWKSPPKIHKYRMTR
ncbi:transposase, IS605 OrfB family [Staphylothermus hellenicus DSM 12710]|uniref:Transposase, IS605 OrfB family n=1 Tax=Staphylothermus hellenicus (strain DSM 12710 / JCM 10830 / BK20S6-10-b1 / P8) TaxID=591019 RepID=D7DB88_STAHD|nr:transposase, IS605 OrfB family [Staphylothermus hellenicus DSM 12710]